GGVVQAHDDADAAGDRARVGIDPVATHGDVVGAAGGDIHHAGHDRLVRLAAEVDDLLIHDVAGRDRAARTVDAQHHRLDAGIAGGGVEPLAEQGHGIFAAAQQAAGAGVHDHAVDVDDGDL